MKSFVLKPPDVGNKVILQKRKWSFEASWEFKELMRNAKFKTIKEPKPVKWMYLTEQLGCYEYVWGLFYVSVGMFIIYGSVFPAGSWQYVFPSTAALHNLIGLRTQQHKYSW